MIDIKKAIDNIKLKLLLEISNNKIEKINVIEIAIPPEKAVASACIFLLLGKSTNFNL